MDFEDTTNQTSVVLWSLIHVRQWLNDRYERDWRNQKKSDFSWQGLIHFFYQDIFLASLSEGFIDILQQK